MHASYLVATFSGIEVLEEMKVSSVFTGVLSRLHLTVDHTSIISLTIDVMHLS